MVATVAEISRISPLKESNIKDQEFGVTVHVANIGATIPKDHIWKPEFWVNVAKRFRPFDEVKIHYEDDSYWAWALVISASHAGIVLKKLLEVDFDAGVKHSSKNKTLTEVGRYSVAFKGRIDKWIVLRNSDGSTIKKGIGSKIFAIQQAQQLSDGEG